MHYTSALFAETHVKLIAKINLEFMVVSRVYKIECVNICQFTVQFGR